MNQKICFWKFELSRLHNLVINRKINYGFSDAEVFYLEFFPGIVAGSNPGHAFCFFDILIISKWPKRVDPMDSYEI